MVVRVLAVVVGVYVVTKLLQRGTWHCIETYAEKKKQKELTKVRKWIYPFQR